MPKIIWMPGWRSTEQHNVLVNAPKLHNKYFRYTTNDYQDGNLFNLFGSANPVEEWAFRVVENVIDYINQHNPLLNITNYDIFGHSAGSQFVHRMVINISR